MEPPSLEVFDAFLSLHKKKNNEDILAFAKKWGTLRRPFLYGQKRRKSDDEAREPLSQWHDLSKHAWELLEIAARLRTQKDVPLDCWVKFMSPERALSEEAREHAQFLKGLLGQEIDPDDVESEPDCWKGFAELYLRNELHAWGKRFGSPVFVCDWGSDARNFQSWSPMLDYGGSLLCFIGCQLGLVLAVEDLYICDGCSQPYLRARISDTGRAYRIPNQGAKNYCGDCRFKVCNRIAAARYREKEKVRKSALKVRTSAQ